MHAIGALIQALGKGCRGKVTFPGTPILGRPALNLRLSTSIGPFSIDSNRTKGDRTGFVGDQTQGSLENERYAVCILVGGLPNHRSGR